MSSVTAAPRPSTTLLPGEAQLILHRFRYTLPRELDAEERQSAELKSTLVEGAKRLLSRVQTATRGSSGADGAGAPAPASVPWSGLRADQVAMACALLKECALLQIIGERRGADEATLARAHRVLRALSSAIKHSLKDQAARLEDSVWEERRRLARDLHDHLGGELAVALRRIELHEAELKDSRHLKAAKSSVQEAMRHTRQLIGDICTRTVTPPLDEGLRTFVAEAARSDVDIDISSVGEERAIPEADRREIFLVLRECLRNALTHSDAARVTISLRTTQHWFHARVLDDGIGFLRDHVEDHPSASHGLRSMNERIEGIGGRLRIDSAPGRGTRVEIQVPLHGCS
ncbi:sensor histidine kinase [Streptomyces sp. NPDC018059]|uniref:sensor histidine kinase n=1 Tax=Streptomyces sp. NPDC018059 TaxID=3365041 RepID=UPI003797F1DE